MPIHYGPLDHMRRTRLSRHDLGGMLDATFLSCGVLLTAYLMLVGGAMAEVAFRHVFGDKPLDVSPKPGEQFTAAVTEFHKSGQNPYDGDKRALEEGKKIYADFCQACHLPDGSGRMGATLTGDRHVYERVTNDVGLFEVVFGGAAGAMQPFGKRLTQDQILKVMVYVRTLMKK